MSVAFVLGVAALGLGAVAAGVAVFVVDSMARATFALLLSFLAVAGLMMALDLTYLGVVTALMMTMEMAVMAVFMLMYMMNPAGLMPMTMVHNGRGAEVAGVVTFAALATGVWVVDWPVRSGQPPADSTRQLGEAVMGPYMLVMLVVGIALLATMVSGTVLATSRGRYDRFGADLDAARPADPVPGGVPR